MNHLTKLMRITIDPIIVGNEKWPDHWTLSDRIQFVDEAIEFLEQNEMYEQCQKLKDVKEASNKTT